MQKQQLSLDEITKQGRKYYIEDLKDNLEKDAFGKYAVIDVEQKKYEVDSDRLTAVEKARKVFGEKLFYIVQIGALQNSGLNFVAKKYAWNL